jgi:hypothetical protein
MASPPALKSGASLPSFPSSMRSNHVPHYHRPLNSPPYFISQPLKRLAIEPFGTAPLYKNEISGDAGCCEVANKKAICLASYQPILQIVDVNHKFASFFFFYNSLMSELDL